MAAVAAEGQPGTGSLGAAAGTLVGVARQKRSHLRPVGDKDGVVTDVAHRDIVRIGQTRWGLAQSLTRAVGWVVAIKVVVRGIHDVENIVDRVPAYTHGLRPGGNHISGSNARAVELDDPAAVAVLGNPQNPVRPSRGHRQNRNRGCHSKSCPAIPDFSILPLHSRDFTIRWCRGRPGGHTLACTYPPVNTCWNPA